EFQTSDTNKNKFDFKFSPIQVLVVIAIGIISFSVTRNGRNLIKHDNEGKEIEEWNKQNIQYTDKANKTADSLIALDNINKIQQAKRSNSFKCNYKILYSNPDCDGGCIDILVSSKLTKDNIIWIVKDVYSKKSIVHLNIAFWNSEKMFRS